MERTILIAEDSPTQAKHLRLLLEGAGYRVRMTRNGQEGLASVKASPPDLIISDVVMPEMDGYAFCRAVKSSPELRRIPFVLLTERNTPTDIILGFERGADNFLTKPIEDSPLLERIRRIFEHLELRRRGHLDVEISLNLGGRQIVINADKQQMVELLFGTLEELVRLNGRLAEARREVETYARSLEQKVEERTRQLLQTEKVATMGQLLAGVAHELNNPLSVIVGHVQLLRGGAAPGDKIAARAQKIELAAHRCSRIVKNFLALARQRPPERQTVDLNRIVTDALELLAYGLRVDDVEVGLDLAADLPPLWADPDQLHQVVVNLVTNAHQAMRGSAAPHRLWVATRHDGERERVELDVADNGPGIAPDVRARVFEPFFTTKPQGQGTGLGLSLCQGVVESHGGTIAVESEPGRGALFSVVLPVGAAPHPAGGESESGELPRVTGKAILVVDDEVEVSTVLAELLATDGHEVETAPNGLVALERIGARAYDLILTDLRMPELDGIGLYREVERRHPSLSGRIVFLTGDALSADTQRFLAEVAPPTIHKPFDMDDILRVVGDVLARM